MKEPELGIYYHFKDSTKHYEVLGIALHTETEERMGLYKRLYEAEIPEFFIRPLEMFMDTVDKPEIGYQGPRFVRVPDSI